MFGACLRVPSMNNKKQFAWQCLYLLQQQFQLLADFLLQQAIEKTFRLVFRLKLLRIEVKLLCGSYLQLLSIYQVNSTTEGFLFKTKHSYFYVYLPSKRFDNIFNSISLPSPHFNEDIGKSNGWVFRSCTAFLARDTQIVLEEVFLSSSYLV